MRPGQLITELVAGPAGALEVAHAPAPEGLQFRGIALVAHPHPQMGGTMDNKVAVTLAKTMHQLGYAAMRFNFRGAGRSAGSWDEGIGETDDAEAALAHLTQTYAHENLVLAGFSFGCFVQTRLWHRIHETRKIERVVMAGPAVNRFQIDTVPEDTIVVHGEEDDVVPLADVLTWARPQQLPVVVLPGCGHFFHGRLTQLQRVIAGMWRP
ncbi:MAG: alpha/beta hydrolase [Casimicrobiaceae bacterium]